MLGRLLIKRQNRSALKTHCQLENNFSLPRFYNQTAQKSLKSHDLDLKIGQVRPLFIYFRFFSNDKYSTNLALNDKNIDCVLGTRYRGGRIMCADESTELWRHL